MRGGRSKCAARIAARPDPELWLVAEAQTESARAQIQGFFYAEDGTGGAGTHRLRDLRRPPGDPVGWRRHGAAAQCGSLHIVLQRRARLPRTAIVARRYGELLAVEACQAAQEAREGPPAPMDPGMPLDPLQRPLRPLSGAGAGAARSAIGSDTA